MLVEVYQNANARDAMTYGFQVTDTVVKVAEYEVGQRREDFAICEDAFERFNCGSGRESEPESAAYFAAGHRSLSKGDVVVLTFNGRKRAYACASFGWTELSDPLIVGKFRCTTPRCGQDFDSESARWNHYDAAGHGWNY